MHLRWESTQEVCGKRGVILLFPIRRRKRKLNLIERDQQPAIPPVLCDTETHMSDLIGLALWGFFRGLHDVGREHGAQPRLG
jgi:hypothetical protein